MNHFGKITIKLAAITQILALTLLSACTAASVTALGTSTDGSTLSNICHATGDPANPYEELSLANDIYPVPASGCPESVATINNGKITICHATGDKANPYKKVTVSVNGLNGHGTHKGDIITLPEDGCPQGSGDVNSTSNKFSICHVTGDASTPYEEITFKTNAELKKFRAQNPDDLSPIPADGCPVTLAVVVNGKIEICHATSDAAIPYNEIEISVNGLNGHGDHEGDIIPAPEEGCPASAATSGEKITICHATGSDKNPYNEITISVSGLSGHNGHSADIIPAPAGGCPITKP